MGGSGGVPPPEADGRREQNRQNDGENTDGTAREQPCCDGISHATDIPCVRTGFSVSPATTLMSFGTCTKLRRRCYDIGDYPTMLRLEMRIDVAILGASMRNILTVLRLTMRNILAMRGR